MSEQLDIQRQKKKKKKRLWAIPHPKHKKYVKMHHRSILKLQNITLLEENRRKSLWPSVRQTFLRHETENMI